MFSFTSGYVLRVENLNNLMHRFLFQIKTNHLQGRIELSNRFRFDTSYQNSFSPIHRIRYKFLVNIPLKESKVYLKLGNEYVNIFSKRDYNLEIRSISSFLLKIKESKKIEIGLDYRLNSFINSNIVVGNFWFFMSYEIII